MSESMRIDEATPEVGFPKLVVNSMNGEVRSNHSNSPMYEDRPWGSYTVLSDEPDHKVKSITVAPGQRLSYQRHSHRSEHWFVITGDATVTLDGVVFQVGPGHYADVPQGVAHRLENQGDEPLVIIEVQYGDYFGEDDIIRLSDDYGRTDD
ncbi:MAG: phosphomannose isomerase type II C-terminal cupin domain [Microthrixaceae bacterium]|nr:phosphomannose isomerase type II C-terminal cupin domain [Microthrixaceae bacterium]HPB45200.1 phosphomannose isomerase type II C-terminal cupin domain [Microthrixaceae bacterium]